MPTLKFVKSIVLLSQLLFHFICRGVYPTSNLQPRHQIITAEDLFKDEYRALKSNKLYQRVGIQITETQESS